MALGYNDRQRLLGLPENENADMDNLVEAPEFQQFQNAQDSSEEMPVLAPPERQFAQSTALENSGSVAPINEESDIPVQTRVPAAADVSAQIKTRSDSSSQAQYNPQSGEAPDLMTQYRKLMDQRKTELEGARKAEMLQNMLSGINSNVGLIIGGNAAKNSGAAVTAPKLGDLAKTDYAGNVDQELKPELEGLMEQYKMLQQDKQAKANRDIQEEQLKIAREGLNVKGMMARAAADRRAEERSIQANRYEDDKNDRMVAALSDRINKSGLSTLNDKIAEIERQIGMSLEEALAKDIDLPGYGRLASLVPNEAPMLGDDARSLRQTIQGILNAQISEQYGATQAAGEIGRYSQETGAGKLESDKTVLRGLVNIKRGTQADLRGIYGGYDPNVIKTYSDRTGLKLNEVAADTSNEVEKLVPNENGVKQSAIFDKNTKQFLRWK
jgi:hypothetical protein